ncbi:protein MAIN-LIKE 1 [Lathyrus oleraceus]|uniref:protein MAIN-LIKE 1 n=1 Tax=Pisum sativum TaxID=3888 RepID=UPI0021CFE8AA|nr:protein MAIN-LIKE 1-like [Pisum sativum]
MTWMSSSTYNQTLPVADFRRRNFFDVFALYTGTLKMVRRRGADGRIPVRTLDRGASSSAAAAEPTGYPGGPYDTSLLVKYEHHVARHIWFGEERGPKKELKVAGHGLKLNSRVPLALPPQMESWVSRSGLASLQRTSLNKIDTNLVSAFMERWHLETSSFHMPFDEMSITLDDVACLLHLPIRGIFWSPQDVTEELAVELAVDYLGVSQSQAQSHVRSCRGSYYKLEWLYDIFVHHRAASNWAYATRAYLLMLVGSTIFADKTFTLVEARYLLLFRDLDGCSGYSWGAAALVTLYRYLGDASMYSCKQLGGYPTLLQCWIHEYFPTVGKRGENWNPAGNCGLPRAMRWSYRQGVLKVDDLRPILDELTPTDVIWRPFEDHRAWRGYKCHRNDRCPGGTIHCILVELGMLDGCENSLNSDNDSYCGSDSDSSFPYVLSGNMKIMATFDTEPNDVREVRSIYTIEDQVTSLQ